MSKKKSNQVESVVGFHISHDGGKIRGNPGVRIEPGLTYQATGRLKMCNVGVHASFTLEEANSFRHLVPGRVVSLVEITGDVRVGNRKVVGRSRKVLATKTLTGYPPTENKSVYVPGSTEGDIEVTVIKDSWFKETAAALVAQYRKNKRKIDAEKTVVVLNAR